MAADLLDLLIGFESIGGFYIILPFLLIFTIVFAILQRSKILGENKGVDVLVALILGLLFIRSGVVVEAVHRFLPSVSLFLVVIIMLLLVIGAFAGPHKGWTGTAFSIGLIISVIFIIWAIASALGFNMGRLALDSRTTAIIVFLVVFIIIIWLVVREPKKEKKGGGWFKKFAEEMTRT